MGTYRYIHLLIRFASRYRYRNRCKLSKLSRLFLYWQNLLQSMSSIWLNWCIASLLCCDQWFRWHVGLQYLTCIHDLHTLRLSTPFMPHSAQQLTNTEPTKMREPWTICASSAPQLRDGCNKQHFLTYKEISYWHGCQLLCILLCWKVVWYYE
jgi:hypothetical protein